LFGFPVRRGGVFCGQSRISVFSLLCRENSNGTVYCDCRSAFICGSIRVRSSGQAMFPISAQSGIPESGIKLQESCQELISSLSKGTSSTNAFMTALRNSYSIDLHPEDVLNSQRLEIFAVAHKYGEDIHPQVVELIESLQGNLGTISSMDPIADNAIFPEVIHEVKAVWDECWKLKALLSDKLDVVEKMVHRFKAEMVSTAELIAVPSGADDQITGKRPPVHPRQNTVMHTATQHQQLSSTS
jgi:hypothetical protein